MEPAAALPRVLFCPVLQDSGPGAVSRFLYRAHYRRTKSESQGNSGDLSFRLEGRNTFYFRKKVVAIAAVVSARALTTAFETSAGSHTDKNHSVRVFPRVLFLHGRLAIRASLWFRMGSPSGAYCCARKHGSSLKCSSKCSSRMTDLQFEFEISAHQKAAPLRSEGCGHLLIPAASVHRKLLEERPLRLRFPGVVRD